ALNNLAGIRNQQRRFEEALAFADASLAKGEGQGGPHELVARVLRAESLAGLGRIEEAMSNYRGALAVRMATIEGDHPAVASITAALAELQSRQAPGKAAGAAERP
ncbi:MAG: tetratricopeptide repeat protein, partial [Myxococcales bacterium]|nr:tetratricopeptide repeat protein [Myxococcales bacterium]